MRKRAETHHEIHDLIAERWSPRAFADRSVEPAKLLQLLEAARWAASCFNEQPWSFIIATKEEPEQFQRLLHCLVEGNQAWAKSAPVLMLSIASLHFELNGKPNRHAAHDVGLAMGNLSIQATDVGLHVHQMAGFDADKARDVFKIPAGHEPMAAAAIGYFGDHNDLPEPLQARELEPRQRKPLGEFVFTGQWGRKAPLLGS